MIWLQFLATALVIVMAGVRLARYGDVLGEKTGLGRSWIGVVLLAATTSLPELFTGFGATALAALPDIALGGLDHWRVPHGRTPQQADLHVAARGAAFSDRAGHGPFHRADSGHRSDRGPRAHRNGASS
jgi:hypothetical protein